VSSPIKHLDFFMTFKLKKNFWKNFNNGSSSRNSNKARLLLVKKSHLSPKFKYFSFSSQPGQQYYAAPPPNMNNVNVVIGDMGNRHVVGMKREWTSGMCNCFDDIGECCYCYFCHWCFLCSLCAAMDESCCSWFCGGLVPLRTKVRTERGIKVILEKFIFRCKP